MKKKLKQLLFSVLNKYNYFPVESTNSQSLLALIDRLRPVKTEYELIRLGPNSDGGYVVPNDLDEINACYSPGVSFVSGFEEDCSKRGMEVYLADASVDGPTIQNKRFHFTKKYIGAMNNAVFMTMD
jgi:hypothetical protein